MPYVWGGTSDGPEVDFGVSARGGYDCSGFVWRVYKLTSYAGEGDLAARAARADDLRHERGGAAHRS